MTTDTIPANAQALSLDKMRLKKLKKIIFDMEDSVARSRDLIRAVEMAVSGVQGGRRGDEYSAIGSVLAAAWDAATEVHMFWEEAHSAFQKVGDDGLSAGDDGGDGCNA